MESGAAEAKPNEMEYRYYPPAGLLDPYINKYYVIRTGPYFSPERRTMPASGCMELIVNIGNGIPFIEGHGCLFPGKVYLSGIMTSFVRLSDTSDCAIVGVQFQPGGLPCFFDLSLPAYIERIVELPEIRLPVPSWDDPLLGLSLDSFFLSRLRPLPSIFPLVDLVRRSGGRLPVKTLAETSYTSSRSLERLFVNRLGVGPKEFAAFVRYKQALGKMLDLRSPESLAGLAVDSGYYDQAHFTKEIKRFAGLTPSAILRLDPVRAAFLSNLLFH